MKSGDNKDGATPISSANGPNAPQPANPHVNQPRGTTLPSPDENEGTVTASRNGGSVQVPKTGDATTQVKAEGFLDNLKGLDFSRVVVIVEEGAAAALAGDWFKVTGLAGEFAQIVGRLGQPDTVNDAPAFPKMSARAAAPHFDRFDKAAAAFEKARSNSFAIVPQRMGAGGPGDAPPVALDPSTILVAIELFSKLVSVFQAWRNKQNP